MIKNIKQIETQGLYDFRLLIPAEYLCFIRTLLAGKIFLILKF